MICKISSITLLHFGMFIQSLIRRFWLREKRFRNAGKRIINMNEEIIDVSKPTPSPLENLLLKMKSDGVRINDYKVEWLDK